MSLKEYIEAGAWGEVILTLQAAGLADAGTRDLLPAVLVVLAAMHFDTDLV